MKSILIAVAVVILSIGMVRADDPYSLYRINYEPLKTLYTVCFKAYTDQSGDILFANPKEVCEASRMTEEQLAQRVNEIFRSAYRIEINVYVNKLTGYELTQSTVAVINTVPKIKLFPPIGKE